MKRLLSFAVVLLLFVFGWGCSPERPVTVEWVENIGGSYNDLGYSVQQTSDGGYVITGYTFSYGAGEWDVYLIKTDSLGDTLWTKTFGGRAYDVGMSVHQVGDGGFIIAGITHSYGAGQGDIYLIKTDSKDRTIWSRTLGDSGGEGVYSIQQTTGNGHIMAGFIRDEGAIESDVYLVKLKH